MVQWLLQPSTSQLWEYLSEISILLLSTPSLYINQNICLRYSQNAVAKHEPATRKYSIFWEQKYKL